MYGRVFRKQLSIMTLEGSANVPISFFRPLKLMPVFPPTEASTCAQSGVGILTHFMPRLKQEAAKPPMSVTMPPPIFTNTEFLRAP